MVKNDLEIRVDETPLRKNIILLSLLFVTRFIHSIIATLVQRGVYADGAVCVLSILNSLAKGEYGFYSDIGHHPRAFISLINQFPINFAYNILGIDDKQLLMMIFSLPLFIFPLIALVLNYLISRRTKRFDVAILGLGLYFLTIAPSALYSIVEMRLAAIFYIILLNYLVGKINYTKFDIGMILFLVLMLFNTHEIVIIIGPILFLMSFYYARNEENKLNKKVKYFIGYSSLIAALYMLYWFLTKPILGETNRFLYEAVLSLKGIQESFGIITFVSLYLILLCIFYKEYFSKTIIFGLTCLYISIFAWFFSNLDMYINTWFFSFRTWPCFALPIIFLWVFAIDYFKIKLGNIFYTNMLTIICFTGILYALWQINHSYLFYKDYRYFQTKLDTISENIVAPDEITDVYSHSQLRRYHDEGMSSAESILFSDTKTITPLILTEKDVSFDNSKDYKFYIGKSGRLHLPYVTIDVKNKFWDLTSAVSEIKSNKDKYEIR